LIVIKNKYIDDSDEEEPEGEDTFAVDNSEADVSDAHSEVGDEEDDVADVQSHRSSQPFLPVTRENLLNVHQASNYAYYYENDLKALDFITLPDDALLCSNPEIDVDKFFVKVPVELISTLTLSYTSKPYFSPINCAFADKYTLQLTTDPFCISVPLSAFLKSSIIESLSAIGDVLCSPNINPRILSARQMIVDSAILQEVLQAAGVSSVYLSSYGGKLSLAKFQNRIGKYVQPWSTEYISHIASIINIPESEAISPCRDPVVLEMNNTFDIGKTYHTGTGSIIAFNALGHRRNGQWRNMYHLLGALTNNPDHPELTFGGLRFTHKHQRTLDQYQPPQDRILRRTVYLVCKSYFIFLMYKMN